jgi:hypothetical protein
MCSDPESIEADNLVCYGSGTTRVGDRMVRGNGAELGVAKNLRKEPDKKPDQPDLAEMFNDHQLLDSWEGEVVIDPANFENLLSAIREDVHDSPSWWLFLSAVRYDTPFYDRGGPFGIGALSGTGCINNKCYSRTELNYIGQGEVWAALGFTKTRTLQIVSSWKETVWRHPPSEEVREMTEIGYDHYQELYPPSPSPVYYPSPYIQVPWWGGYQ